MKRDRLWGPWWSGERGSANTMAVAAAGTALAVMLAAVISNASPLGTTVVNGIASALGDGGAGIPEPPGLRTDDVTAPGANVPRLQPYSVDDVRQLPQLEEGFQAGGTRPPSPRRSPTVQVGPGNPRNEGGVTLFEPGGGGEASEIFLTPQLQMALPLFDVDGRPVVLQLGATQASTLQVSGDAYAVSGRNVFLLPPEVSQVIGPVITGGLTLPLDGFTFLTGTVRYNPETNQLDQAGAALRLGDVTLSQQFARPTGADRSISPSDLLDGLSSGRFTMDDALSAQWGAVRGPLTPTQTSARANIDGTPVTLTWDTQGGTWVPSTITVGDPSNENAGRLAVGLGPDGTPREVTGYLPFPITGGPFGGGTVTVQGGYREGDGVSGSVQARFGDQPLSPQEQQLATAAKGPDIDAQIREAVEDFRWPEQVTDPGPTPVDPGPTPVDPGPTPVDPGPTPIDSGPAPVDSGPTPVDSGPTPVDPGPTPVDPGPTPVDPGPTPIDPGPAPIDPGPAPIDPGPTPIDPGPTPIDPGPTPIDPGPTPVDEGHQPFQVHLPGSTTFDDYQIATNGTVVTPDLHTIDTSSVVDIPNSDFTSISYVDLGDLGPSTMAPSDLGAVVNTDLGASNFDSSAFNFDSSAFNFDSSSSIGNSFG